jgi:micrococcal nuclease
MTIRLLGRKRQNQLKLILGAILLLCLTVAYPQQETLLTGQVVGVHDGDTITLLTADKENIKVRLSQIDAPESKQPFGAASKKMLSDLVFDKKVAVRQEDRDRYGRTVGTIFLDGTDINREMVRQGGAWVYEQYAKDPLLYEFQKEAQMLGKGLWALPTQDQIQPWEWRKQKRASSKR